MANELDIEMFISEMYRGSDASPILPQDMYVQRGMPVEELFGPTSDPFAKTLIFRQQILQTALAKGLTIDKNLHAFLSAATKEEARKNTSADWRRSIATDFLRDAAKNQPDRSYSSSLVGDAATRRNEWVPVENWRDPRRNVGELTAEEVFEE